ncbi:MAG: hypothetical protein ACI8UR_000406 [Natronomonas sp.]|jgi:hypothetical protein|uniref:DUF7283 family protein n=1 Tax=Natronomonas sp. TaxID=2184060 RepID=UPI00398A0F27
MFDIPLDALYVWLGLTVVSGAAFGVASAVPAAPPPDASGAAETVDSVAASRYGSVGSHPLSAADAVRIGRDTVSLRGPGETTHATLGYGPVTPATTNERLLAVLHGEPPERVFATAEAFERAVESARAADPRWHRTDRLLVRRISWEETDVVLVG